MEERVPADQASPLQELIARAGEAYKRALIGHQPGLVWDYLLVTAANEHQAAGYRREFDMRSAGLGPLGAFFPANQQTLVVPDPPGFRVGSGGATFAALRALAAYQKTSGDKRPLESLRILVVHSGGASQRIPQFSPLGKIFAPLPLMRPDGQIATVFDHLYLMLAALPPRLGPGMLVASGDVFLLFDALALPRPDPGILALAMRVPAAQAQEHGVFLARHNASTRHSRTASSPFSLVQACLQKVTAAQMRAAGALDARGHVLIDSGLLYFDAPATVRLGHLARRYTNAWHLKNRRQIDLYADIVPTAIRAPHSLPSIADTPADPLMKRVQADFHARFTDAPLRCFELPHACFLHLGTTRHFRDAMTGLASAPAAALFTRNVRVAADTPLPRTARVYQSVLAGGQMTLADAVVIENCRLSGPLAIGRGSVLSHLSLQVKQPRAIPPDTLLFSVPIQDAGRSLTVTIFSGVHDDFKTDRTFCNIDLRHWLMLAGLAETDLWPADHLHRLLWNAHLFPGEALPPEELLWMTAPAQVTAFQRAAWKKARRYSMAEILALTDAEALARHRDAISGLLQATQWIDAVKAGAAGSVQNTINHFGPAGYQHLVHAIAAAASDSRHPPLQRSRLAWSLAEIAARPHFPRDIVRGAPVHSLQKYAFACIREAMAPNGHAAPAADVRLTLDRGASLLAVAPVRLDLAGGWTDTPPYCLENGGTVVNVAVDLNDTEPIQAEFRLLDEPLVRLVSRDLGKSLTISDPETLRRPIEPGDPFALMIVALRLAGIAPCPAETTQRRWLSRLVRSARGFELTTTSHLPKGSGMGTSSILGAATLAVLRAAARRDTRPLTLVEQTLLLEQHLGTGGGWQDQVGGIVGGVKITESKPGIPQSLKIRPLPLSASHARDLESRLVVYFTGQQRLARNILREVMGRYLSREPGTMVLFHELTQCAAALETALRKASWFTCATEINRYWRIKRDLFAGSTTPAVDALFLEMRPYYLGGGLAGAGGGGFAYFLCADPNQAHRLRTELARVSMRPGSLGLTFASRLNGRGLRIVRHDA